MTKTRLLSLKTAVLSKEPSALHSALALAKDAQVLVVLVRNVIQILLQLVQVALQAALPVDRERNVVAVITNQEDKNKDQIAFLQKAHKLIRQKKQRAKAKTFLKLGRSQNPQRIYLG